MTTPEAITIVRRAFAALSEEQRANLRFHAANGTRVACGEYAELYVSPQGYG